MLWIIIDHDVANFPELKQASDNLGLVIVEIDDPAILLGVGPLLTPRLLLCRLCRFQGPRPRSGLYHGRRDPFSRRR